MSNTPAGLHALVSFPHATTFTFWKQNTVNWCGDLTLAGYQVPTTVPSHTLYSARQGEKIQMGKQLRVQLSEAVKRCCS